MPEVEKISISGASIDIVDKKVVQTPTTTNANYEVLFSKSANDTEETDGVRKTEGYIFNPNSTNMKLLGEYNTFSATPTKLELYNSTYKHSEITPGQLKLTDGTNVGSDSVLTLKAEELGADITNSSTWDGTNTSLKTAVTGLSSKLANKTTWKLHNSATGQASISISTLEYDELLIVVEISGNNKGVVNIPKINLTSSNSWYRTGGYGGNSGYMAYYAIRVTTADVSLNNATLAGTDYTSTAVTKVYYR